MRILWWPIVLCLPFAAQAQSLVQLQAGYAKQAVQDDPSFKTFSAARGQRFFLSKHGNDWSCASCHTSDPTRSGKHDVTGRAIQPLAPAAKPKRFTDAAKAEKWFRRNCRDVARRECSALEKGDVLAWLGSLGAGGVR